MSETFSAAPAQTVQPICRHYGSCGGCQMQDWASAPYQQFKAERIRSALGRRGIDWPDIPLIDAHGAGRRRVALHVRKVGAVVQAGFMAARSHDLIDIERCPILVPALADATAIARDIGAAAGDCDVWLTAASNGLDASVKAERKAAGISQGRLLDIANRRTLARLSLNGEPLLVGEQPFVMMGRARVPLPPGPFLQATQAGEDALARLVIEEVKPAKRVADLFCGLGPFALRLAERARVEAFDSDKPAIAALQSAVRITQGLKPLAASVRNLMSEPLVTGELKAFDAVVLDPPRAGAEAQCRKLSSSQVKRIAYVSCDPESFARDAAILMGGGYRLETVTAVDQFRYSRHVECVGGFRR